MSLYAIILIDMRSEYRGLKENQGWQMNHVEVNRPGI